MFLGRWHVNGAAIALTTMVVLTSSCSVRPMTDRVVIYKPVMRESQSVRISDSGRQQFRIASGNVTAIVGILPERDPTSGYVLTLLVLADATAISKIDIVDVELTVSKELSENRAEGFSLLKISNVPRVQTMPTGDGGAMEHTWSQRFAIDPDLDPRVHKALSLKLVVKYTASDGKAYSFETIVPVAPESVNIPKSIV